MNYAKLRGRIVEKYRTQSLFASAVGLNVSTLNGRLNNKSQWTAGEIEKSCELLDIPLTDVHQYFFCSHGCNNATEQQG